MEQVFESIIAQWGAVGIILAVAVYIIIDSVKNKKSNKTADNKLDNIIDNISNIKIESSAIKNRLEFVEKKMDLVDDNLTQRIEILEDSINKNPQHIINELDLRAYNLSIQHNQKMMQQISIAPKIHEVLNHFIDKIGCDHIFLGWFHNGTSSISGVPFYKFDIVAEKFHPNQNPKDYEFGHMYKDVDILRHNKLPIELIQNNYIHYIIDENRNSELSNVDDILYRRMIGSDINQIALNIIKDINDNPIGFVGCITFDVKKLNFNELKNCANEIKKIYD